MRASRLLSILIVLQLRGRVTANALSQEFEVSVRSIYRDIDALSAAGVPVYGDRGPGGGFALLDGWRMQLTGLSADEAEAMAVANLPEAAAALGIGSAAGGAGNKLLAALPPAAAARADRLARRVHVDLVDWYRVEEGLAQLPDLFRAVLDERRVAMRYDSWTQIREWTVDPLGLTMKGGHWYLVAHGAGRVRSFRVSNMSDVVVQDEGFARPPDFDLPRWWFEQMARFEGELRPTTARLRVEAEARTRVRDLGAYAAAALKAGCTRRGVVEIDLPVENPDQAARLVLGLAPGVTALDRDLAERVKTLALSIVAVHAGA